LYYVLGAKTERISDPSPPQGRKATLVEIRSTGAQTLFPPTRHQAGPRMWESAGDPTRVGVEELVKSVRHLGAAAMLARHWRNGSRQNTALALAGALLRGGLGVEAAEQFVEAVAIGADDDEVQSRVAAVRSAGDRLKDGRPAFGFPTLEKVVGTDVAHAALGLLGLNAEPEVGVAQAPLQEVGPVQLRAPYFEFMARDWSSDYRVRALSAEQRGLYVDLIAYAWTLPGQSVPNDEAALAAIAHVTVERWRQIGPAILATCCVRTPEGYSPVAPFDLRANAQEVIRLSKVRALAGARGGRVKRAHRR
jgi:hypothetical protein